MSLTFCTIGNKIINFLEEMECNLQMETAVSNNSKEEILQNLVPDDVKKLPGKCGFRLAGEILHAK